MPGTEFLGYIYRLHLLEKFVEYHNPKSDINVLLLAICQQWQLTVKENKTLLLNEKPPFFLEIYELILEKLMICSELFLKSVAMEVPNC